MHGCRARVPSRGGGFLSNAFHAHSQIIDMHSAAYIERQAREQWQLVPAGLQAFVVKGLPQSSPSSSPTGATTGRLHLSLSARLGDLWHTLRE